MIENTYNKKMSEIENIEVENLVMEQKELLLKIDRDITKPSLQKCFAGWVREIRFEPLKGGDIFKMGSNVFPKFGVCCNCETASIENNSTFETH